MVEMYYVQRRLHFTAPSRIGVLMKMLSMSVNVITSSPLVP